MSPGVLFVQKVSCFYEKVHNFANFEGCAAILNTLIIQYKTTSLYIFCSSGKHRHSSISNRHLVGLFKYKSFQLLMWCLGLHHNIVSTSCGLCYSYSISFAPRFNKPSSLIEFIAHISGFLFVMSFQNLNCLIMKTWMMRVIYLCHPQQSLLYCFYN